MTVPGLSSSNLTYTVKHSLLGGCPPVTNAPLWPTPNFTTEGDFLCWETAMRTVFNPLTGMVESTPGVEVDTVNFGAFNGTSLGLIVPYWQVHGFVEGVDIFCAPFDWRLASSGLERFFTRLQALVEHAYTLNDNRTVDLLAVSFGPQVALSFLHRMTPEWKAKYIRWFVAESPLWSGSPSAVLAESAGYRPYPNASTGEIDFLRMISASTHSTLWIFPREGTSNTTWTDTEPIVSTPSRKYMSGNLSTLLEDLGFEERARSLAPIMADPDLHDFAAPGVDTVVVYGTEVPTAGSMIFSQDFDRNPRKVPPMPQIINDPQGGDSLVNVRSSLRSLYAWPAAQRASGHQLLHKV